MSVSASVFASASVSESVRHADPENHRDGEATVQADPSASGGEDLGDPKRLRLALVIAWCRAERDQG